MVQPGLGREGGSGPVVVDSQAAKPKRRGKGKRDGGETGGETVGGGKKAKGLSDGKVVELLRGMYAENTEAAAPALSAVTNQMKIGHARMIQTDATLTEAGDVVARAVRAEIRRHTSEIALKLTREDVVPSKEGLMYATQNSGKAITAIHEVLRVMGAPDVAPLQYAKVIEALVVNSATCKVGWDEYTRLQRVAAQRMARAATEVGKLLREWMSRQVGVLAPCSTREETLHAYFDLATQMRQADEAFEGCGVLPAGLRTYTAGVLLANTGNRFGGVAPAEIAQASGHTMFARTCGPHDSCLLLNRQWTSQRSLASCSGSSTQLRPEHASYRRRSRTSSEWCSTRAFI
jgi:hypothetical protein